MNEEVERHCRAIDASVYYEQLKLLQEEISELYDLSEDTSKYIIKMVDHDYFGCNIFQQCKGIEVNDYKRKLEEFDKIKNLAYYLARFADRVLSIYKLEQQ